MFNDYKADWMLFDIYHIWYFFRITNSVWIRQLTIKQELN